MAFLDVRNLLFFLGFIVSCGENMSDLVLERYTLNENEDALSLEWVYKERGRSFIYIYPEKNEVYVKSIDKPKEYIYRLSNDVPISLGKSIDEQQYYLYLFDGDNRSILGKVDRYALQKIKLYIHGLPSPEGL